MKERENTEGIKSNVPVARHTPTRTRDRAASEVGTSSPSTKGGRLLTMGKSRPSGATTAFSRRGCDHRCVGTVRSRCLCCTVTRERAESVNVLRHKNAVEANSRRRQMLGDLVDLLEKVVLNVWSLHVVNLGALTVFTTWQLFVVHSRSSTLCKLPNLDTRGCDNFWAAFLNLSQQVVQRTVTLIPPTIPHVTHHVVSRIP